MKSWVYVLIVCAVAALPITAQVIAMPLLAESVSITDNITIQKNLKLLLNESVALYDKIEANKQILGDP